MKYHRLKITNYRGVDTSEIHFQTDGLTLVQGPNEIGKSSLREAISILFDYPASSKHKDVVAIRPVHRDEGTEIELEAESGPYRFVYRKRYHKKPQTTLVISAPQAENLTGREAHDRAAEILAETLDYDLWKALTWVQGDAIDQPNLEDQQSLSAALDRVAGGSASGADEESLFERVETEYLRYFTPKGREKNLLQEARQEEELAADNVARIQEGLDRLDQAVDKAAQLEDELRELEQRETTLNAELEQHRSADQAIQKRESTVREAELALDSADKSLQLATRNLEQRQVLIQQVEGTDAEFQKQKQASQDWLAREQDAQRRLEAADKELEEATEASQQADRLLTLRQADADHFRNQQRLDELRLRRERIDSARQAAAAAAKVIEVNRVDDQARMKIEQAVREVMVIQARRQSAAPQVRVQAERASTVEINGERVPLESDEVLQASIPDRWELVLPDHLKIEIQAGSSIDQVTEEWEDAQAKLQELCQLAGLDDPGALEQAHQAYQQAQAAIAAKDRVESENLADLTYDQLDASLRQLEQQVPEESETRVATEPLPPDLETAQRLADDAKQTRQSSQQRLDAARRHLQTARKHREQVQEETVQDRVQLASLEQQSRERARQLETERAEVSDEQLCKRQQQAHDQRLAKQQHLDQEQQALAEHRPQQVRALLETCQESLATCRTRLQQVREQRTAIRTTLELRGQEGLFEQREAAETRLHRCRSKNRSLFRQAQAAELLYLTMKEQRDAVRRSYVQPLKERIESLGRLMFDESFEIQMDENLQIDSRTLDGITVPFESLSGGSREQLSIIFRLACSMIVSQEGGLPLIMDDALGYTDPQRLRRMGVVLAQAARECQIVVLTCVPERYAHVGQAHIVPL